MRENLVTFDLKDGHKIYGYLERPARRNGRLVIISHGLAGSPEEYIHVTARNVFNAQGYDVLRIYYYSKFKEARMMRDGTYAIFASDLSDIVKQIRKNYKWIGAVGHSSGGLITLMANPDVEAVALWEPPFIKSYFAPIARHLKSEKLYAVGRGAEYLVSEGLYNESADRKKEDCLPLAQNMKAPTLLMLSESGRKSPDMKILFENLPDPKEKAIVTGADHLFTVSNTAVKLINHTAKWFAKF